MTITVTQPALNLRSQLTKLSGPKCTHSCHTFWTSGDTSKTIFALPTGWIPSDVFVNGAIMRPGSGEDYTIAFDGLIYSIVFAIAPAAVDIAIQAKQEI